MGSGRSIVSPSCGALRAVGEEPHLPCKHALCCHNVRLDAAAKAVGSSRPSGNRRARSLVQSVEAGLFYVEAAPCTSPRRLPEFIYLNHARSARRGRDDSIHPAGRLHATAFIGHTTRGAPGRRCWSSTAALSRTTHEGARGGSAYRQGRSASALWIGADDEGASLSARPLAA